MKRGNALQFKHHDSSRELIECVEVEVGKGFLLQHLPRESSTSFLMLSFLFFPFFLFCLPQHSFVYFVYFANDI